MLEHFCTHILARTRTQSLIHLTIQVRCAPCVELSGAFRHCSTRQTRTFTERPLCRARSRRSYSLNINWFLIVSHSTSPSCPFESTNKRGQIRPQIFSLLFFSFVYSTLFLRAHTFHRLLCLSLRLFAPVLTTM